jgi:hypothetical protein
MPTEQPVSLLELLKFCEREGIAVTFWYKRHETLTGVPEYKGFDIDTGELFEVKGHTVALHDFRSIVIVNPDHHLYRESHPRQANK